MPEGHSIHRLARQFSSVFVGERLEVTSPQGRFTAGAERVNGHVMVDARAHGKQLFLEFDNELVIRVHLGLYGAWSFGGDRTFSGASSIGAPRRVGEKETYDDGAASLYDGPPPPVGAVRVRLVGEHGWADLRGPTACEIISSAERPLIIGRLGPDPLDGGSVGEEFVRRARQTRTAIGLSLMNQAVIAGVGNVYRAEVLFRGRISPWRPGLEVSAVEAQALWVDLTELMEDGVRIGRIVTTEPSDRSDPSLDSAAVPVEDSHYVYKRTGQQCRICGSVIQMTELGARKVYWCGNCQSA